MEQEGRMASTIGRRLSTLLPFYKYCQLEDILDRTRLSITAAPARDGQRTSSCCMAHNAAAARVDTSIFV